MKQERNVSDSNGIIVFDRNVSIGELSKTCKNFHGDVIVKGNLYNKRNHFPNHLDLTCSLWVYGRIIGVGNLSIAGDLLYCKGGVGSFDITVAGNAVFEGDNNMTSIVAMGEVELYGLVRQCNSIYARSLKCDCTTINDGCKLCIGC